MGRRNSNYVLTGNVEVDECMMTVIELSEEANAPDHKSKRGRGSSQAKVLVMATFDEGEDKHGHKFKFLKKVAMDVLDDFSSKSIGEKMSQWISKRSKIYTDKFKSYNPLKKYFDEIIMRISSGKQAKENLPIVHQQIGNFKGDILGIYRSVSQLHLQNYLNEFCYKVNRRFMLEPKFAGTPIMENIVLQSVKFLW
jgi:hypothetical protein